MRNLSLTVKIWLALFLVSLFLYLVVGLVTPHLLRNFLTDNLMEPRPAPPPRAFSDIIPPPDFHIRSFVMLDNGGTIPEDASQTIPQSLQEAIKHKAEVQEGRKQLYEGVYGGTPLRYVVEKNTAYGRPFYKVTFLRKPEEDHFVRSFLFNIMLYVGLALVVSWLASILIVRYLTRPLKLMRRHVKRIADRNWHEPLNIEQKGEVGELALSIDTMRRQLIQQDEMQQSLLQSVSHELKTPVMVIRSYAQAMQDGIYPKGDLAGSVQVIDEEGERLEKLVKQLLYLTRLDYLAAARKVDEKVSLDQVVEEIVERLRPQRPEIIWEVGLRPVTVTGDEDTLRVMVENLLDNHLRYASSTLRVTLEAVGATGEARLRFWNDGVPIEPHVLERVFAPFQKGREGKFGLGLAIVQRILNLYNGRITLANEDGGVATTVHLPLQ